MSCGSEQAMPASIADHNQVPRRGFSAAAKAAFIARLSRTLPKQGHMQKKGVSVHYICLDPTDSLEECIEEHTASLARAGLGTFTKCKHLIKQAHFWQYNCERSLSQYNRKVHAAYMSKSSTFH